MKMSDLGKANMYSIQEDSFCETWLFSHTFVFVYIIKQVQRLPQFLKIFNNKLIYKYDGTVHKIKSPIHPNTHITHN